jgi:hypothetical protein
VIFIFTFSSLVEQLGELAGFSNQKPVYQIVDGASRRQHPRYDAVVLADAVHPTCRLGVVHGRPRTLDKDNVAAFAFGPYESDRGSGRLNVADEHAALGIAQERVDG